ncbi:hypothetical protein AJ80_01776 [Polytolypa hystricis UAMH7299]|uniref:Protein kinase domain-containing protein n=1 Tax=Polytolypa hystricis (strain UAMH7299) TaxID=1447883 RepID=A0A2B7YZR7_POLH7|nr:hypothetical protein AJ80_01776 [Polytolypa hystricis UAMH7299]
MELNINLKDVIFYKELHSSEHSMIFHYRPKGRLYYGNGSYIEPSCYKAEVSAYKRLQERGLGEKDFVPRFYGREGALWAEAVEAITGALVMHGDLKPRNRVVVPAAGGDGESEKDRVLLIDFDRAQVFDEASITEEQREWLVEDNYIARQMARDVELDVREGRLKHSYLAFAT